MSNRIVIGEEEEIREQAVKEETAGFTNTVKRIAEFDFRISADEVWKHLPFILYACLLVMLFIYNGHQAEKLVRKTEQLNRDIKELRSEYITVLSELMGESKQSEISKKLEARGIKELKTPPRKITIDGN